MECLHDVSGGRSMPDLKMDMATNSIHRAMYLKEGLDLGAVAYAAEWASHGCWSEVQTSFPITTLQDAALCTMNLALSPTAIVFGLASLAVALYWYFQSRRQPMVVKDPYGLFHLTLNHLPGDDVSAPPKTEWLNMGYWKVNR